MKEPRGHLGWLIVYAVACIVGPALMQLLIAYVPSLSKGVLDPLVPYGAEPFYSTVVGQEYALTDQREITIFGRVLPMPLADQVEVEVNGEPYTPTLRIDSKGGFWPSVSLDEYENTIVAREPRGSRASLRVFYLPEPEPNRSPPPIPRSLSITLSPARANVAYRAIYAREEIHTSELLDLRAGKIGADLFLKRIFYPTPDGYTGKELSLLSLPPDFAVYSDTATVTITATVAGNKYTPANIRQLLAPTLQIPGAPTVPITIALTLDNVVLTVPPTPWPDEWQDNRLQWVNPPASIRIDYEPEATTKAALATLNRLWLAIQAALVDVNELLGFLILPIVPSIPFLWLLLPPLVAWIPLLHRFLPSGIRHIHSQTLGARRSFVLGLALGTWLVPMLAAPSGRLIHESLKGLGASLPPFPGFRPEVSLQVGSVSLWAASLSYCILMPLAYRVSLQRHADQWAWLRWLGLVATGFLLSAGLVFVEGYLVYHGVVLMLMAAAVLGVWSWMLAELWRPGLFRRGHSLASLRAGLGLATLLVVLAVPLSVTTPTYDPVVGWQPAHWLQFFVAFGSLLLPYTALAGLLPCLLARESDQEPSDRPDRYLGGLVFAAYVVGFLAAGVESSQWIALHLIPFLLGALWIYPLLLRHPSAEDPHGAEAAQKELAKRPTRVADMRRMHWRARQKAAQGTKKAKAGDQADKRAKPTQGNPVIRLWSRLWGFLKKLASKLTARSSKQAENRKDEEESSGELPKDYVVRMAVFAFGPTQKPRENVKLTCRYGLILTTVLFLAYSPLIVERANQLLNTPFPLLQMVGVLVLPFYARWLLAAFLLGYFFPSLRGANGLQKGLVLGAGIVACTLPSNLLFLSSTAGSPLAILWDAVQTLLFLSFLGLWAFDLNTIKRYGLGWKDLLREHGLAFALPYLSTIGGAIGATATGILTGRLKEIVTLALELILRGAPPLLGGS